MEGQYERVSQSRELLYSVPAALCEEIARAATEELAERLSIPDMFFGRCQPKMVKRGTPAFVFGRTQKRCHETSKMKKRDNFKSGVAKNGEDRALVKHGNARAGERHQLVGHQMNEQVRHRAVQALEGEPARSPERVLTPLSGILGTRSVGKPAMKLWRR